MRILHIIPNLKKGGAERLVLDICRELHSRDVEYLLITFSELNEYQTLSDGVNLEVITSSIGLRLFRGASYNQINLERRIQEFKPDIIHTHLYQAEIVSRSIKYPDAKWFSHGHDNMRQLRNIQLQSLLNKQDIIDAYEKHILLKWYRKNGGTHFLAISNDVLKYLNHVLPGDLRNVTLLPNAINVSRFKSSENRSAVSFPVKLVTTGSLVDKKNQSFLIEVASILKAKQIDFQLDILGDGPNRIKLEEMIRNRSLENRVVLHGKVNLVEQFLWDADLYVHSATHEPFGLALIEAMAAGLPIVCLDGKGNRDIIKDGKNGYMIMENDALLFANMVIQILRDLDLYKYISNFNITEAKQYNIKFYTDKLLKLYSTENHQVIN